MLNNFISNDHAKNPLSDSELFSIRKEMVMRHVAWITSLTHEKQAICMPHYTRKS